MLTIYSKERAIPGFFYQHLPLKINMIPHSAQCVMVMDAILLPRPAANLLEEQFTSKNADTILD